MANLTRAALEEAVRYHHPEKALAMLPTRPQMTDAMISPFFGTDVETYKEIKASLAEEAHRCAGELLENVRLAGLVDRLPFESGTTVVGLGDSITDDSLSWFEILHHLLALHRPTDGLRLVNAGISGDTTSGLLSRVLRVLEEEPAWVLTMIGTNDVPFVREPSTKALVSREETAKNLYALRDLIKAKSGARLAWLTPPPVIEERTFGVPVAEPVWRNKDLAEVAKLMREVAGEAPLVDLWEVFGDPKYLLPDGLHPSLAGQKATAAALVERLSEG